MNSLTSLFEAKSVAVVGASDDPHKLGGRPIAYMKRLGYQGQLIPINPKTPIVQGLAAKSSLAELDAPVDLAVIATPEKLVEGIIRQGLTCGIKNFVVFASGYAEINEDGISKQQELETLFKGSDARLLGPNCLGFINTETQLVASFTTAMEHHPLKVGGLSFAGHSGALGAYWLDKTIRANLGVSKWISSGNEVNIQLADIVDYLANDPQTSVICLYIEEIRQPEKFEQALLLAKQQNKPVIAMKGGKTNAGARATQAHTASNPFNGADYQAIFDNTGVIEVASLSEMIRYSEFYLGDNQLLGQRLGLVSISGGAGVMLSDQLTEAGFCISDFSDDLCRKVQPLLSDFSALQNPIDLTAALVAEPDMLKNVSNELIQSEEFDAIVIFMGLMDSIADKLAAGVIELKKKPNCPIFLIWMGGQKYLLAKISETGVMVFEEIPELVALMSKLAK